MSEMEHMYSAHKVSVLVCRAVDTGRDQMRRYFIDFLHRMKEHEFIDKFYEYESDSKIDDMLSFLYAPV